MKRLILTLFVELPCFTYQAEVQWAATDPPGLVQNIKSAVQSSTAVTNTVKLLQESVKIYNQNKAYYDTLKSVHNIIKDVRRVRLALGMVSEIMEIYTSRFNRMVSDLNFTVDELAAISAGYAWLLEESDALVAELKTVIAGDNGLSLSDKEWIDVVDQVYTKMLKYRNLTRYYTRKTASVSFIHSREKGNAHRVSALCGNPNDRYW